MVPAAQHLAGSLLTMTGSSHVHQQIATLNCHAIPSVRSWVCKEPEGRHERIPRARWDQLRQRAPLKRETDKSKRPSSFFFFVLDRFHAPLALTRRRNKGEDNPPDTTWAGLQDLELGHLTAWNIQDGEKRRLEGNPLLRSMGHGGYYFSPSRCEESLGQDTRSPAHSHAAIRPLIPTRPSSLAFSSKQFDI